MNHPIRQLAIVAVATGAAVLVPAAIAEAHNATISCSGGGVRVVATDYPQGGSYRVNGGNPGAFSGGFTLTLPGDIVEHIVITAPDWPTYTGQAGPCVEATTTTIKETTTTWASTSTSTSPSTPSTTSASSTSVATTSPLPPPPSSNSSSPSTSSTPSSTTRASTSTVAPGVTQPRPPSPPPAVAALPVTGTHSSTLALIAGCCILIGAVLSLRWRRA